MNITNIDYPIYVQPVVSDKKVELTSEYLDYDTEITYYGLKKGGRTYIYDCSLDNEFEERIKQVRIFVNSLAKYDKFIDMPTDLVYNSGDLVDVVKEYKSEGIDQVRLVYPEAEQDWTVYPEKGNK